MAPARFLSVLLLLPAVLVLVPAGNSTHSAVVPCTDTLVTGTTVCPDLIVDPAKLAVQFRETETFGANSCDVQHGHTVPGTRELVRFYFSTPNVGLGDLIIGAPSQHPEWFTYDGCHRHYHMREYADYRLWTPDGFVAWQQARALNLGATPAQVLEQNPHLRSEFVAGNKMGFCVIDIFPYVPTNLPQYNSCSSDQGITAGWADEYAPGLSGQWVDVTGLPTGAYVLEAEVNAERMYVESDYTNNASFTVVVLP